jgi:hypothetical protein
MSDRWTTRVDQLTGRTIKSGIDARPVRRTPDVALVAGYKYRAVVLQTYATDAVERTRLNPNTTRKYEVECDVLLMKSGIFYPRVPVMQRDHGVNNAAPWIPKATTRVIGEGELNFVRVSRRGTKQVIPSNFEELDGDQVILEFMEGDIEMPLITGSLTHAKTNRLVKEGSGWTEGAQGAERGTPYQDEKYFRYRGVELRVNDAGDVLIDTVGATNEDVTEAPTPTGGQMRVRVKPSEKFTVQIGTTDVLEVYQDLTGVHVDIGEGATEHLVLGEKLLTWLSSMLSPWILAHTHLYPAPPAPGNPTGPAVPVSPFPAPTDILSTQHKTK